MIHVLFIVYLLIELSSVVTKTDSFKDHCVLSHFKLILISLNQGSSTLLLESYRPTDFSSNPNQTHLNQLIKVFKATC